MSTDLNDGSLDSAAQAFGALDPVSDEPLRRDDDSAEAEDGDEPLDNQDDRYQDTGEAEEGDEPGDAEADEQEGEPEPPAIDPPVSWDADAKARFAKLPPDDQRYIAERESQRDRALQVKATEAAEHRKAAQAVTERYTQLHRQYADELETYAQAFHLAEPDYGLIATDPQEFARQTAAYKQAQAQHEKLMQRADIARQHSYKIEQQARDAEEEQQLAENEAELVEAFPGWERPDRKTEVLSEAVKGARRLGYPDKLILTMSATDIKAAVTAAKDYGDAEKWRALQRGKMEQVRSAKTLPKVAKPGTAQPRGSGQRQGLQESMTRLRASGSVADAAAAFRNMR